ncbi:BTAD domain-containing putative transcriptional regulator, partial [Dactylosporangium sp. NPDC005572]|uniref:BTAD domain-containing putative transcriptional regulator n=1 Tax=Dactylosporangium sp. NPDC005572 TaxID=3156889 RepID=UPI0033A3A3C0
MTSLRIGALGPLRAGLGGAALDLGGPRQRAVLARLVAAGGHVVPADRFVDDLWQGEPPPKAMAALQVYVSNLRRVLEPDRAPRTPARVVVSVAPGYALRLPAAAVDAWHFEDLLRRAAAMEPAAADPLLQEALAAWAGPAYAEFRDEPWAVPEVARLEELRLVCVETAGQVALRLGRAALAVPELERHVQAHPLREQGVALLAAALYRAGRQADALAALRAARERLADELGVDPGPALRAVEADVLAHAEHLAAPAVVAPPSVPLSVGPSPSLSVGRDPELGRLDLEAAAAERHGLRVVWVGGEAGAGKTTLLRMFGARLAGRGWQVLWGRCPEVDGAPPAWAWTELLGLADLGVAESFELARAAVERLGDGGPLLVVLDDVHRADGETLQVLRHVAVELAGRPVLVAATHRPGEGGAALAGA